MSDRGLARAALTALLPCGLQALARRVDAAVGLLLSSSLDLPDLVPRALGLLEPAGLARDFGLGLALGSVAWIAAALWAGRGRVDARALGAAGPIFLPLLLRPALTVLALVLLSLWPAYPYGFTLPVALTQDWAPAQDLAAAAALLAGLYALPRKPVARRTSAPRWRLGRRAPRAWELGLAAFLLFALTTPENAWHWDGHPGNEPKYLRMAVALGHFGGLDVERVQAPMEQLGTLPLSQSVASALHRSGATLARAAASLADGPSAFDPAAIRAQPAAHLTVRGPDGGAYHVLAPGPSLLLAPALRLDRALNRARGTPGRVAVAVLSWNLLAATVVALTWLLARAAGAAAWPSGLVAAGVALSPPLLFYAHQFYPEVPAAAILAGALLALRSQRFERALPVAMLGLALACLPWLHQKYLPLWAALCCATLLAAVERLAPARLLGVLLAPQALTLLGSLALNLALTGSPRPDALFRALGRTGVGLQSLGQGFVGLLLDARYGLVPMVPWLLLAAGGLALGERRARWLARALPVPLVYYLTVAAAENWTGSISNLGRFLLPVVPVLAALAALAFERLGRSNGLTLGLALVGWSAACARLLWLDPAATNDSGLLLARSSFADAHVYLPNLLLRRWSDAAAGLPAQLAVWLLLASTVAWVVRRAAAGQGAWSVLRVLAALVAATLACALVLERWPGARRAARFEGLPLPDGGRVLLGDGCRAQDDEALCPAGELELVVRSPQPKESVELRLRPAAGAVLEQSVDLRLVAQLTGRRGHQECLAVGRARLPVPARVALAAPGLGRTRPRP